MRIDFFPNMQNRVKFGGGQISSADLLTIAIAKRSYEEMRMYARAYYAMTLPDERLKPQQLRGRNVRCLPRNKMERSLGTQAKREMLAQRYRRKFNVIASWFYNGDFSLWFNQDLALCLIDRAKEEARRAVEK